VGLLGNEVRTANDGKSALEIAGEFAPEVVVLDLGMPRMDGFEVARRMRESAATKDALLVAVTGYSQDRHVEAARAAGLDHHLTKPVEIEKLRALIVGRGKS